MKTDALAGGITLHRHYLNTPDELGTVAQWQREIDGLFSQLPFPAYWSGLVLSVWHMDHPDLKAGVSNLRDYDPNQPGCQVAAGLYWGKKQLDIGVFPDNYNPNQAGSTAIPEVNRTAALRVLSHEIGHMHHDICGLASNRDAISNEITRLFRQLRPNQTPNEYEDWAETYRAVMGTDATRGTFSDNKPYAPSSALLTLMKAAYWLSAAQAGKVIHSVSVSVGYAQWAQRVWWWDDWYRLSVNTWQAEKWNGSGWIKS